MFHSVVDCEGAVRVASRYRKEASNSNPNSELPYDPKININSTFASDYRMVYVYELTKRFLRVSHTEHVYLILAFVRSDDVKWLG